MKLQAVGADNFSIIDTFEVTDNCYYTFRVDINGRMFESLTDGTFKV